MKLLNDIMMSAMATPAPPLSLPYLPNLSATGDFDIASLLTQPPAAIPQIPAQQPIQQPMSQQQVISSVLHSPAAHFEQTVSPALQPAVQPPMHLISNFPNYQDNDIVYN